MVGIRKKITFGFVALSLVLFFSGAISVSEMSRLRRDTAEVIDNGTQSAQLAKRMLDALQLQNGSVLKMVILGEQNPDEEYYKGVYDFNVALLDATNTISARAELDAIYNANDSYHALIGNYAQDSIGIAKKNLFLNAYVDAYYRLDSAIKDYMTSPQSSVAQRMSSLERNIYKTITPSIMTLIVALLIVLMFYFFIDIYYMKPLLKINKNLGFYLKSKIPYEVKFDSASELSDLNDNITTLIEQQRKQ